MKVSFVCLLLMLHGTETRSTESTFWSHFDAGQCSSHRLRAERES